MTHDSTPAGDHIPDRDGIDRSADEDGGVPLATDGGGTAPASGGYAPPADGDDDAPPADGDGDASLTNGDADASTESADTRPSLEEADTYTVDLHAHTRFFHWSAARPTVYDPLGTRLLTRAGRARGVDAIALTNHDYYQWFDGVDGVTLLPGIEISSTDGHVLVVGPDPPTRTEPGELTPAEAVDLAHDRGCVAILPHPFRRGTVRESDAPFDAIEVNGKHPQTRGRVHQLAAERGLPVVGGSDAHFPFEAGRCVTEIDADELTVESVVEAIRDGRVAPVVQETRVHQLLRRGYGYVHSHKHRDRVAEIE